MVELKVAGVDDQARRRRDAEAHAIRDTVTHAKELHGERTQVQDVLRGYGTQVSPRNLGLMQLDLDEPAREPRGIDRGPHSGKQVGQSAGVVLVAMGDDDAHNLVSPLDNVGQVRDDDIHTEHVVLGDHETRVDDQQSVVDLQDQHVPPDLAESAEGNDAQFAGGHGYLRDLEQAQLLRRCARPILWLHGL